jgi:hypothetical protein
MSELAPFPHVVRYESIPYNYGEVQSLLKRVAREFGRPGDHQRWYFETVGAPIDGQNHWIMDFRFRTAEDAIMFGLKYQR